MSDWDFIFELLSSCLEFIVDIAISDGVKALFEEHFSSSSFNFLNEELFLEEVFVLSGGLAPLLPGFELDNLMIRLRVENGKLHGQENLLFEPHLCDELTHIVISIFETLSFGMCQPHNESLSLVGLHPSLHNLEQEFLLALSPEADISPVANESSHCSSLFALSESSKDIQTIHLESMASFSPKVSFSPGVEELGLDFLVGIESNQVLVFVVLMHEVHGMPIPFSETVSLSLRGVFLHDLDEFSNSFLKIVHILGTVFDFLDGIFGSHIECL